MEEIEGSILQSGSMPISTAQQNIEEDEDLEEQKRRQKEIESFLKNAMDEFNYDDQSTASSSSNSSVELGNKYLEAPVGKHLEVLYNIRVKEVETLSFELEQLKLEMAEIKSQQTRKLMLAEAETESLRISLKNAQELMVEKCANLDSCSLDKSTLKQELQKMLFSMQKIEHDNSGLRHANENLTEQVAILEKGRGANPLSDACLQEIHNTKISKLQASLENAISKAHRLEKENATLTEQLNAVIHERDDLLANKTEIINRLMQNIDEAQTQNQELLTTNQHLKEESDRLRVCLKDLENNVQIMKGFTDKTEIIKMLQCELEKAKQMCTKQSVEFEKVKSEHAQVLKTAQDKNELIARLQAKINTLQITPTMESNGMQTSFLSETQLEMSHLKELIALKDDEIHKFQEKLLILQDDCLTLSKKLDLSEQKNTLTAELQEKARKLEELLLNNRKAVSVDRSANTSFNNNLPGDNSHVNVELLRAQFESELIEHEVQLRQELETEFERRYTKFTAAKCREDKCRKCEELLQNISELKQLQAFHPPQNAVADCCNMCAEMKLQLTENAGVMSQQSVELQQFRETQQKDRKMIVKVLEEWKVRFQELELQKQVLEQCLEGVQEKYASVQQELSLMKKAETQLLATVRVKAENALRQWQHHTLQQVHLQNMQIQKAKKKVEIMSRKTDSHIQEIEQNFSKAQSDLKLLNLKNNRTS